MNTHAFPPNLVAFSPILHHNILLSARGLVLAFVLPLNRHGKYVRLEGLKCVMGCYLDRVVGGGVDVDDTAADSVGKDSS